MFTVGEGRMRNCQGWSRRELLRVGGLGLIGDTLAQALGQREAAARTTEKGRREVSCIVLWLDGGPSHFETFDPKPDAPDTIRGPYGAIRTKVPGIQFSELLPQIAERMNRCAIIRSLSQATAGIRRCRC